ncbi:hypothetical protein DFR47_1027 [Pseudochrobactrum asaccharolyticum]|uniref:Uncharacterized protein n=1 Tax=Pseudochrobactrum asaccharolyticum TaxID=354351 RepID=A0A366E4C8_9HYPH|nr:hypothetical protein DFR47_1027 [Pseudochrobactrum asaccharolyticum]
MSAKHKRDAVRIALTSGLTGYQVTSDLSFGLLTHGKWNVSDTDENRFRHTVLIFCVRMSVCVKNAYFARREKY